MDEPVLSGLRLAAEPSAWAAAGFAVDGGVCVVGGVSLELEGGAGGIVEWALDGPVADAASAHPNGVEAIDHVVKLTPDLERSIAGLEAAGIRLRRRREGETGLGRQRQAFFRLGLPILELVESAELGPDAPDRFWGITFTVADLEAAADLLGPRLGSIRDAVQPGRRIAPLRREARLGLPVALISRA